MKTLKTIAQGQHYTAVGMGPLESLSQYSIIHPKTGAELRKVFLKEATGATGTEISFQSLPPHTSLPYFHTHVKNEETYIILKGSGLFQVGNDCFPVSEGSIVRVAPQGARSLVNTSDMEMIYMVIQSREGSLEEYSSADGQLSDTQAKWPEQK